MYILYCVQDRLNIPNLKSITKGNLVYCKAHSNTFLWFLENAIHTHGPHLTGPFLGKGMKQSYNGRKQAWRKNEPESLMEDAGQRENK